MAGVRRPRGATLLELIIVSGILSIVVICVGTLIRVSVDYNFYSTPSKVAAATNQE